MLRKSWLKKMSSRLGFHHKHPHHHHQQTQATGRKVEGQEGQLKQLEVTRPPLVEGRAEKSSSDFDSSLEENNAVKMGSPKIDRPQNEEDGGGAAAKSGGKVKDLVDNYGGAKPKLPSNKVMKEGGDNNTSPSTNSQSSSAFAGFEPEGSVDTKSPVSETSSPPAHLRWQESLKELLDDREGYDLFKTYLIDQNLEHFLTFYTICNGYKEMKEKKHIVIAAKQIIKNYFWGNSPQISCVGDDFKKKIHQVYPSLIKKEDLNIVDTNFFDGAKEDVYNYMSDKFYANFFKSDTYLGYLSGLTEFSVRNSGTQSSASSVSGRIQVIFACFVP